jgi:hypothetical protein
MKKLVDMFPTPNSYTIVNGAPSSYTIVNGTSLILKVAASIVDRFFNSKIILGNNKTSNRQALNYFDLIQGSYLISLLLIETLQQRESLKPQQGATQVILSTKRKQMGKLCPHIRVCSLTQLEQLSGSAPTQPEQLRGIARV